MDQYSENEVKKALTDFHPQIVAVVRQAFAEWLAVQDFRAKNRFSPVLYTRTVANYIFDGIARYAKMAFDDHPDVRVINEAQTIKICFREVVIARFKKGDDSLLGRNIPTQAVLNFIDPEQPLPNLPPAAAKVEFIYVPDELGIGIGKMLVVARDNHRSIWSYELNPAVDGGAVVVPLLFDSGPDDEGGEGPLVAPKKKDSDTEIG